MASAGEAGGAEAAVDIRVTYSASQNCRLYAKQGTNKAHTQDENLA